MRCVWVWSCALLGLLLTASVACADDTDPVVSGSEALQRSGSLPRYDAENDGLKRVSVQPPGDPPSRPDVEGRKFDDPANNNTNLNTGGYDWLGSTLMWGGWSLIGLVILLLLVLLIRAMANRGVELQLDVSHTRDRITTDVDRIEQLPVPIKRNLSDLLGEARRHYEQGNYNEAIIYLYSYLLVELDKTQHIRLLRGQTNRQYLREMRDGPATISDLVERTMVAFEDVFFGEKNLERSRFESCYNQLGEFHQHVEPAAV